MTKMQLYTRVLTELHPVKDRDAHLARLYMQDVLIELRNMAAEERGDPTGQETQDVRGRGAPV